VFALCSFLEAAAFIITFGAEIPSIHLSYFKASQAPLQSLILFMLCLLDFIGAL
jgi:hypothetical protein